MRIEDEFCSLRGLIAEARLKRQDIAELMGCSETMFSLYINGRRKPPTGFKELVLRAIDRLRKAETAAQEARERALAEDENDARELVPADAP